MPAAEHGASGGAAFRDHFSASASEYALFRPTYPRALYRALAKLAPARNAAWDCGTGSGQAALGLTEFFERVIATDASASQLEAATRHERIEYRRAAAEQSGLPHRSVELVTVAQAVHWFDLEGFYGEVRRVVVDGGLVALWGYGGVLITPPVDALLERFYTVEVGPYWPPERRFVDERYATLPFPFQEVVLPSFSIERDLTRHELTGYLRTWSATQRYIQARGHDPVAALDSELAVHWPDPGERKHATWPIFMRAGFSW